VGSGDASAWLRRYLRRNSNAKTMKLRRAKPPITPPTMAPVLLELEDAEDGGAAAALGKEIEELPELVFIGKDVDVFDVLDCDGVSVLVGFDVVP
jgi:hypothetical protein